MPFLKSIYWSNVSQKYIKGIYAKFPQPSHNACHHVHAALAITLQQWQIAEDAKRTLDISKITVKAIERACANISVNYPSWPDILYSPDLSKLATEQLLEHQWWIPDSVSDDDEDHRLPIFSISYYPRHSLAILC
jgi:hypothetical protein